VGLSSIEYVITKPVEILHRNEDHKVGCYKKEDDDFEIMEFLKKVKTKLDENPKRSTQQLRKTTVTTIHQGA
jgi:hypothetical protein